MWLKSDKFWDKTAHRYAKSPVSDEATYPRKLAETQSEAKITSLVESIQLVKSHVVSRPIDWGAT